MLHMTRSALKISLAAIIFPAVILFILYGASLGPGVFAPPDNSPALPFVQIGETKILVEVATSSAAIQKGLSGKESLAEDQGMLFIFSQPDFYRFWMPDMHFSIDIIWIDEEKVVGIEKRILPEFNPENPRFYTPPKPVRFVLEVNGGFTEKRNIRVGDKVVFRYIQ